jgi:A/G-specific adenine glycosylase
MTVAASLARRKSITPDSDALLSWYDRHRRVLPWRAPAGGLADPYRVWLSEIMLQQTTVKTVGPYFLRFLERFPTIEALAAAPLDDVLRLWAGLGYYARARNLHACSRAVVERFDGEFPPHEAELLSLPGVGAYTAAAIAAIAFDHRAMPVDGNVERVITRLYAIEEELPGAKETVRTRATSLLPATRCGDFAQAMMDLGATICTPKSPACALCPWREPCRASARGDAESFPRKAAKREGQLRRGAAFVVIRDDAHVLVRTRPPRGLLGGMTEVPTTEWSADYNIQKSIEHAPRFASVEVKWRRVPGLVRHVFTHFPLDLAVFVGRVPVKARAPQGAKFVAVPDLPAAALPTVMRKVLAHGGLELRPSR